MKWILAMLWIVTQFNFIVSIHHWIRISGQPCFNTPRTLDIIAPAAKYNTNPSDVSCLFNPFTQDYFYLQYDIKKSSSDEDIIFHYACDLTCSFCQTTNVKPLSNESLPCGTTLYSLISNNSFLDWNLLTLEPWPPRPTHFWIEEFYAPDSGCIGDLQWARLRRIYENCSKINDRLYLASIINIEQDIMSIEDRSCANSICDACHVHPSRQIHRQNECIGPLSQIDHGPFEISVWSEINFTVSNGQKIANNAMFIEPNTNPDFQNTNQDIDVRLNDINEKGLVIGMTVISFVILMILVGVIYTLKKKSKSPPSQETIPLLVIVPPL